MNYDKNGNILNLLRNGNYGRVLKRTYSTGEYWEYDGALVHKNGQSYQLATPEGRANYASGVWTYEYFIQDHLGNARVSFKANGSTPQPTIRTTTHGA
ncbi:hypothetical protein [Flectobacillus longus]|uniref:hypothetical protein n=1 Tax=Flectobacillus longus TaxID=2984207 RepID=UPI0024B6B2BC|nr:hypothetical protein [Flectobacillus longus]MDI9877799.1 hypothetical protein [Flectobacillus longus]